MKNNFQFLVIILSFTIIFSGFTFKHKATLSEISIAKMETHAKKVLNDLKIAKGILSTEPPFLKVRQFTGSVKLAVFYKDLNEIHLDSLSYEIMREMGKDSSNALAFLLGHELGHYINKHKRVNHAIGAGTTPFVASKRIRALTEEVNEVTEINDFEKKLNNAFTDYNDTHDEAEADFEGGFLGYLAGYQPMEAGKEFLKRAYDHPFMNLTRKSPGYPSYQQRLEIIETTTKELEKLIPLFEMSNYLMAIEQFDDAIPYLEKVLAKFQSKEIYNNIAVIHINSILQLFEEPISEYRFPLTLDADFRIPHPFTRQSPDRPIRNSYSPFIYYPKCHLNEMQKKIILAESYIEKALILDPDYVIGYLNLSISQTIKALLYDHNRVIDQTHPDCSAAKSQELTIAEGTAHKAREKAEKQLNGFGLYLYSKADTVDNAYYLSPTSSIEAIRAAEDSLMNARSSIWTIAADEAERDKLFKKEYRKYLQVIGQEPFEAIHYGQESFIRDKSRFLENIGMADTSIWVIPSFSPRGIRRDTIIPDMGVILSNIHMQIDILKILQGELNEGKLIKKNLIDTGTLIKGPFEDAIETNFNNQLAWYNRKIALQDTLKSSNEFASFDCKFFETDIIEGTSENEEKLLGLQETTNDWNYIDSFQRTRILTDDLPWKNFSRSCSQHSRYVETDTYKFYSNESEINHQAREEHSYIFVPKKLTKDSTLCNISLDMKLSEVTDIYGTPKQTVSLSNGSLIVISQDEIQFKNNDVTFITKENGLILRLNNKNEIESWAQFYKRIKMENDGSKGYSQNGF